MSDFFQKGITTLHNLGVRSVEPFEAALCGFAEHRPINLVWPCLYSETEQPALVRIVSELAQVPYLADIIIGRTAEWRKSPIRPSFLRQQG